ncbi:MAG: SPOR domain-containing protein, partial [Gemmatimonadales bacterium]
GARESAPPASGLPAAPPAAVPETATPPAARDTLGWTIQLAAYGTLERALAHADRLSEDILALVTPVPQEPGGAGPVWYRVVAGSYRTREAAAAARDTLWRDGLAPRGIGDLLYAPYSFTLAAGDSVAALRARALPAVRPANATVILIGAFETREQAAFTQAALVRAGVRAALLPRLGTS